ATRGVSNTLKAGDATCTLASARKLPTRCFRHSAITTSPVILPSRPAIHSDVDAPCVVLKTRGTMPDKVATNITSLSHEIRVFPPPKQFSTRAHIKSLAQYRKLYNESVKSPEKFWAKQAKNEIVWFKP